jgi:hypothetical protein
MAHTPRSEMKRLVFLLPLTASLTDCQRVDKRAGAYLSRRAGPPERATIFTLQMTRSRRLAFVLCIAILSVGLAGGTVPCAIFDALVAIDPLFSAVPFFTLSLYDGVILRYAPPLEVLSPRAPPLASL